MLSIRTGILLIICLTCITGYSIPPHTLNPCLSYCRYMSLSETDLTPMKALDMVKDRYAGNFTKIALEGADRKYYYKLEPYEYYLVYEELEDDRFYLIHLYEFVMDEPETGIGHTVTYGWYAVDRWTGSLEVRSEL